jgi:hypothetical protein
MQDFLDSVEESLKAENWYAALTTALILPDICGWLTDPEVKSSQKRYVEWFNTYMLPTYTSQIGAERVEHVFLSGKDCYSLRCALLHEGGDDIERQRARDSLTRFHFTKPLKNNNVIHLQQYNTVLQLQVDIFCREICAGVRQWLDDFKDDTEVLSRMNELLQIF